MPLLANERHDDKLGQEYDAESDMVDINKLAEHFGMAPDTIRRWISGESSPHPALARKSCPCVVAEEPLCSPSCWHFGHHKSSCRFCKEGRSANSPQVAHLKK